MKILVWILIAIVVFVMASKIIFGILFNPYVLMFLIGGGLVYYLLKKARG